MSVDTKELDFRCIKHISLVEMSYCPVKECASCPKLGLKTDGVAMVLLRVELLEYLCPKQVHYFKPSVAPLYSNMGQVISPIPQGKINLTQRNNHHHHPPPPKPPPPSLQPDITNQHHK